MRLAYYDIRPLGQIQGIRVVDDHMDRADRDAAAAGAGARRNASAIAMGIWASASTTRARIS